MKVNDSEDDETVNSRSLRPPVSPAVPTSSATSWVKAARNASTLQLLDRDVVFALIKTEGLDEVGRERIAREAQAMGRLGTHPHVVSVF